MKETVQFAKYNQAANKSVYDLLSTLSNDNREQDRGSFYGSLSGLFRHVMGGTYYFLTTYKPSLGDNPAAIQAISAIDSLSEMPEGTLNETQWKELEERLHVVDTAYIAMAEALAETDMELPVAIEWYGGDPASVPLSFMLNQLLVHNTHHRGQISQILDSLKIENDYSGIPISCLFP
ncbi:MAG: damage-inducible protein DinB [Spirochaetaceae bacterium]|jgi:uncharacterized damage-inducible protein DinB|nr:damage-inducible protein DinB [Spirochaetaceae bacterium]